MNISQLVTDLSLEFIRHFCNLFKSEFNVTPSNFIHFINRLYTKQDDQDFIRNLLQVMEFEKVKNFFFKETLESLEYHNSLCCLLAKSLSLLFESVSIDFYLFI